MRSSVVIFILFCNCEFLMAISLFNLLADENNYQSNDPIDYNLQQQLLRRNIEDRRQCHICYTDDIICIEEQESPSPMFRFSVAPEINITCKGCFRLHDGRQIDSTTYPMRKEIMRTTSPYNLCLEKVEVEILMGCKLCNIHNADEKFMSCGSEKLKRINTEYIP